VPVTRDNDKVKFAPAAFGLLLLIALCGCGPDSTTPTVRTSSITESDIDDLQSKFDDLKQKIEEQNDKIDQFSDGSTDWKNIVFDLQLNQISPYGEITEIEIILERLKADLDE
jgi:hypothetical protein